MQPKVYCCHLNLQVADLLMEKKAWLALQRKYQHSSRQRGPNLLRRLNDRVVKANTIPGVLMSEIYQLRNECNDLDEVVSIIPLTTMNLDALPTKNIQP